MLACSFLIESSSKLLVTRKGLKARLSSILGRIWQLITRPWVTKLSHFWTWISLKPVGQSCVASLGWGKGCVRFWGRLTLVHWTQVSDRCPLGYLLLHPLQKSNYFVTNLLRCWMMLISMLLMARNEFWSSPMSLTSKLMDQQVKCLCVSTHGHDWCSMTSLYVTDLCQWSWQ